MTRSFARPLLLVAGLFASTCTSTESLVELTVSSPEASLQGVRLGLSANDGAPKYYGGITLTPAQPFLAGFYLAGSIGGTVDFRATVDDGRCVVARSYPDPTPAFDVASGKKVALALVLKPVASGCDPLPGAGGSNGGGAGTNGGAGTGGAGGTAAMNGSGGLGGASGGITGSAGHGGAGGTPTTGGTIGSAGHGGTGGVLGTGGVVGTGGIVGTGGVFGTGGIVGTGGAGACGALIDDMESGTGRICQGNGRTGMWFTYVDSATGDAITPVPGVSALPEVLATPRGTSQYAMHISGTYSTYAGFGCWLDNTSFSTIPISYNGSAYAGVRFWAKGKGTLRVTGQMASTEPTTYGGTCTATSCAPNVYAAGTLTSEWTQIQVPFSLLTGGTVTPFQSTSIWSLEFGFYSSVATTTTFDLWIDDLTFY